MHAPAALRRMSVICACKHLDVDQVNLTSYIVPVPDQLELVDKDVGCVIRNASNIYLKLDEMGVVRSTVHETDASIFLVRGCRPTTTRGSIRSPTTTTAPVTNSSSFSSEYYVAIHQRFWSDRF
jgi:hypothetical protein